MQLTRLAWAAVALSAILGTLASAGGATKGQEQADTALFQLAWTSDAAEGTYCVAWADYDGDLDLACANKGPNRLQRNMASQRKGERVMDPPGFTKARLPDMRMASSHCLGKEPENGAMERLFIETCIAKV